MQYIYICEGKIDRRERENSIKFAFAREFFSGAQNKSYIGVTIKNNNNKGHQISIASFYFSLSIFLDFA